MFYIIIAVYLLVINFITFYAFGIDKRRARLHLWRVTEKTLIGLAFIGGSIGASLGMKIFHHKTKKIKFYAGIPIIFLIQVSFILLLLAKNILF